MYACLSVTCHLLFWQNDQGLLPATAVTLNKESAHKVNSGEENSPTAPAGVWSHNLSITSLPLLLISYPSFHWHWNHVKAGCFACMWQLNWKSAPLVQWSPSFKTTLKHWLKMRLSREVVHGQRFIDMETWRGKFQTQCGLKRGVVFHWWFQGVTEVFLSVVVTWQLWRTLLPSLWCIVLNLSLMVFCPWCFLLILMRKEYILYGID